MHSAIFLLVTAWNMKLNVARLNPAHKNPLIIPIKIRYVGLVEKSQSIGIIGMKIPVARIMFKLPYLFDSYRCRTSN